MEGVVVVVGDDDRAVEALDVEEGAVEKFELVWRVISPRRKTCFYILALV